MIVDHGRTTTENVVLFLCSQLLKGFLPRTQVGQHFEASVRNGDTLQCPPPVLNTLSEGELVAGIQRYFFGQYRQSWKFSLVFPPPD